MGDRFNQQQGNGFPIIDHMGIVANERKENETVPGDLDHFGMADIEGTATVHLDAKGTKWPCLHIFEDLMGRHLKVSSSYLFCEYLDCEL
jgi:hypothetical protein